MNVITCEIVVIALCASLAFMPAYASDFTLGIFGNANMDDTIDEMDIEYVRGIIGGANEATELADANYDGVINEDDISHIEIIIRGEEKKITIVDSSDRIVTVNKPLTRMVVTFRHALEMLRIYGVNKDRIVGVESLIQTGSSYGVSYSALFPEYQDKPTVGTVWTPECEAILDLKPDVVFLISDTSSYAESLQKVQEVLESAGVTVIRIHAGVYGEYNLEEVKMMGYLFDAEDKADDFIEWYEDIFNSIDDVVNGLSDEDKPTVYFETGSKWSCGAESNVARITRAGGKNIFPDSSGSVNPEAIIEQNPDVIIKAASSTAFGGYHLNSDDTQELEEVYDEIISRPELQTVKAVMNGHVYVISGYILGYGPPSGGRGFLQDVYMAKWLHPDLFEDLDPQAIHQEYLTRFQGLDYDLEKHGVFVYPPLEER